MRETPHLVQVNVSPGGVPKLPVPGAMVRVNGVEGDRQAASTVHGGPHRAVSILGIEAIRRVAAEGHPIAPGTTGENLTVAGFDVSTLPIGTRLRIGDEVELELASAANPCRTIRHSFADLRFGRLGLAAHPADSRMYARVLREGMVRPGDPISVTPPVDDRAERYALAARLDEAVRSACLSLWRAAVAGGAEVAILDEGDLAAAASRSLPGFVFNQAIGFAHLPNLAELGVAHLRAHTDVGWLWADEPPWPDAVGDARSVFAVGQAEAIDEHELRDGLVIREIAGDEVGAWAEVIIVATGMSGRYADAWRSMEVEFARAPHDHRFIGEIDGRAVATGAIHTHHGVGYLRSGCVLPEFRGRGFQRAMIEARISHAARLGCDLVGSIADEGGTSARNLERAGMRVVAVREAFRVDGAR
jgi:MOSC domain-containing protein YiiM/ribosomal protein S18 acetylase RimI-like enzyme